ncbi:MULTISPECIES: triose-phosphate isomerase [unclassified Polaribacter]|uniref:triose-phosphate isomerase n=1 Tax=unclassified Polaribacter TaxID=196858 RepID=UPI0011BE1EE7|nr:MULTISPECIES: triose-phosphate isomerase [unclassified Polaribacter]TXD53893.1 triose-phosphate isomerase [Polaribacter sp. IC063]TXD58537.1 triose-phosphate isomerase [Polaribacter sp. IC066]
MRQKIVAGNWKMNNDKTETKALIKGVIKSIKGLPLKNTRVIIAPSYISLSSAVKKTKDSKVEVASQNMHQAKNGAYTGEISADMLKAVGIKTVIIGHSERREYFNETDKLLAEKMDAVLANGLEAIFCFGEKLEQRKKEEHLSEVGSQLEHALFHLKAADFKNIILAYEPVWAIGTGETASPEQAQEMHAFVRSSIAKKFGVEVAESVSILYGGSVKPANAEEIFSKPDVDGGLIGGAALKAEDFSAIIKAI